jgi:hypothetical protein
LIAGLSSSASAGPIGCTSGLDALEFGAFDFGVLLPGFFGVSGVFAMAGIWDSAGRDGSGLPLVAADIRRWPSHGGKVEMASSATRTTLV